MYVVLLALIDKLRNQRFGSISFWRGSGSGSLDPHFEKVDPDPDPKWIRIRVPIFHIFHKEIHVGQIKMLIFITAKI